MGNRSECCFDSGACFECIWKEYSCVVPERFVYSILTVILFKGDYFELTTDMMHNALCFTLEILFVTRI